MRTWLHREKQVYDMDPKRTNLSKRTNLLKKKFNAFDPIVIKSKRSWKTPYQFRNLDL